MTAMISLRVYRPTLRSVTTLRSFSGSSYLNQTVKVDLFSKDDCQLCHNAKQVLDKAIKECASNIDLHIIDITKPENKEWWNAYCFDVPVVHINTSISQDPIKFMHRFNKEKLIEALNEGRES